MFVSLSNEEYDEVTSRLRLAECCVYILASTMTVFNESKLRRAAEKFSTLCFTMSFVTISSSQMKPVILKSPHFAGSCAVGRSRAATWSPLPSTRRDATACSGPRCRNSPVIEAVQPRQIVRIQI